MKTLKNKFISTILCVTLCCAVLFSIVYFAIGSFFYDFALNPDSTAFKFQGEGGQSAEKPGFDYKTDWFKEAEKADARIVSDDGLSLRAQTLRAGDSRRWAITIHGYRGKSDDNAVFAYYFYQKGFNVLMPDLRGHGESGGGYIGMGWPDRLDIVKWIDYIIDIDRDAQIVLHGISMGGATVMATTGESLPPNVKCAIEDCGYSSVYKQFSHVLGQMGLSAPFIMTASDAFVRSRAGFSLKEASSVVQLQKSDTPTLFIHGEKDDFVPYYMLAEVYAAAKCEKDLFAVPEAKHGEAIVKDTEGYLDAVFGFVGKYVDMTKR